MVKQNGAEQAQDTGAGDTGEAWLRIDRGSDEILSAGAGAQDLLGVPADGLTGQRWQSLLASQVEPDRVLARLLASATRCNLPPVLIRRPDGLELIAAGQVAPLTAAPGDPHTLTLHLRQVGDVPEYELVHGLAGTDTVVVLGVEADPGCDIALTMMDIRASLLDIVRAQDTVGLPVGTTIGLVLREIDIPAAQDICRALLSHLHSIPRFAAIGELRLSIGLARVAACDRPMATLLAANRALQLAQYRGGQQPIAVARDGDAERLASRALNADGVFSHNRSTRVQRTYLARLLSLLESSARDADTLPGAVVDLTLQQGGLSAMAVYRRRRDNVFACVAAGQREGGNCQAVAEEQLPRVFAEASRRIDSDYLEGGPGPAPSNPGLQVLPLRGRDEFLGYLLLWAGDDITPEFTPDPAALHTLALALAGLRGWRESPAASLEKPAPLITPMETGIEGYVGDNMEGAVDQAIFLARLDVPVAIIGPRGTGKLYVARIIHQESGGAPDTLREIDCREFSSRKQAERRIAQELRDGEGKTLVFKSPQLMNADAQLKLARQISTRTLADVSPPRYLPPLKLVALFPDDLDKLVRQEKLVPQLASAFAAYPIKVPPIKDRKQAVLRWAHKILGQECALRERLVRGFTPDAEQAMLQHDWPGNISEMRQCIVDALEKTDKEWITPVDLGIFKGISAEGAPYVPEARPFLAMAEEPGDSQDSYTPSVLEELDVALGEAVNNLLALQSIKPLGTWLEDELVLAVCDRFGKDTRGAADFLHTRARNIGRWLPRIRERQEKRDTSPLWQESRRLVKEWVRDSAQSAESPLQVAQAMLLAHVSRRDYNISLAERARIMGVSTPTYQKRLQESGLA